MMARKLKKNKSSSTKRPSFFKVMIGDFEEKLRVPTSFIRHFNGKLPHKSILRSPTGRSWSIRVKKVGDDLFFTNGWQAFVIDHSLELGDFLVFRYKGESKFNVTIYGRTGCEKEVHLNNEEPMSNVKKVRQEQEQILNLNRDKEDPEPRKTAMEIEKKAGAGVGASSIKTKRVHFIAIWRQYKKYHVTIPRDLAIENDLKTKRNIVLQDPEGRSWPMIISPKADGRANMTDGLKVFSEGNRLAEGDIILFEFLNLRKDNKMGVRIFRNAEVNIPSRLMLSKGSTSVAMLNFLNELPNGGMNVTTHVEDRAIEAAKAFESENPFCSRIMRPSYVNGSCTMTLPPEFGRAYLMQKSRFVNLRVPNGRMWQVRCLFSGIQSRLTTGWKDFVLDNHLEEGDVCVFELVDKKNFEMKVSIFRVSQYVV